VRYTHAPSKRTRQSSGAGSPSLGPRLQPVRNRAAA
jgi:hypothetical protein